MENKHMGRKLGIFCAVVVAVVNTSSLVLGAGFGDLFGGKKGQKAENLLEQKEQECRTMINEREQEFRRLADENKDAQETIESLREKNSTLMEAYEKVVNDQETVTEQLNRLRRGNQRCEQIQESYDQMEQESQAFVQENENLENEKKTLVMTLESLKSHIGGLTSENEELNRLVQEAQEDDAVKLQKVTSKVNEQLRGLKRDNDSLRNENETLSKLLKEYEKKSSLLNSSNLEIQKQSDLLRSELASLKSENSQLENENRYLAQEASEFPKKFTDLARHNRKLIKDTAHMHYNLGVSFIKSKEYERAIKEFKKVLELDPEDPFANYNLGYIYAEHLVDRPAAIKYFQTYLTYAKDAKDADWVKKYILTWQTWYGKEKMK